jgi:hypothetical protein
MVFRLPYLRAVALQTGCAIFAPRCGLAPRSLSLPLPPALRASPPAARSQQPPFWPATGRP